jgi:sulfonate transport system permease protein
LTIAATNFVDKPNPLGRAAARQVFPWLVPLALLALWQFVTATGLVDSRTMPKLSDVAIAGWNLASSGELERHIGVSFVRAGIGFLIGGSIGWTLGLLNGTSKLASTLLDSTMQMVRNVPHLALTPLVFLWFGVDESGKLFLVALGVFFPIYLNTYHGIRTVDAGLLEMGRVYGLMRWGLFWEIMLPAALPSMLVGLRYALGIMWLTLIVAEASATSAGIGYMTMNAREFLQTDVVVLGILIYALLGKLADVAARRLELWSLSWHPAFQK